jgi:hypothetical protein
LNAANKIKIFIALNFVPIGKQPDRARKKGSFALAYPLSRQSRAGDLYLARKDHTVTESGPPLTATSVRRSGVKLSFRFRRCCQTAARKFRRSARALAEAVGEAGFDNRLVQREFHFYRGGNFGGDDGALQLR